MRILLLASHGIAEFDDVRMFAHLGQDVFCPGGYADPARPGETLRPGLPDAPSHPELARLCERQREKHAGESNDWAIDWAKADLHPELIDWAEVIIVHHFPERWIAGQWDAIRRKRVIWRTCGQSNPNLERFMRMFRDEGMEIVRYSPAERRYFESVDAFAGQDALIRFGKFPADYGPWTGTDAVIGNVTQWRSGDDPLGRGEAVGLSFWLAATAGLPAKPAGPGSESLPGGIGTLSYDEMREYLRRCRAYLYTGTTPASYTLGLIEAALSGMPIVSIPPEHWAGPPSLFEGWEFASDGAPGMTLREVRECLIDYLNDPAAAKAAGDLTRQRATREFGVETVGRQWLDLLGATQRTATWVAA